MVAYYPLMTNIGTAQSHLEIRSLRFDNQLIHRHLSVIESRVPDARPDAGGLESLA
jgi:hypothetical protein